MARAGGEADKQGNYYEALWTVQIFLELLRGEIVSVHLETPGEDKFEFTVVDNDGIAVHYQVKQKRTGGSTWSLADLAREDLLEAFFAKCVNGDRIVFAAENQTKSIGELSDRAMKSSNFTDFETRLDSNKWKERYADLKERISVSDDDDVFSALRQMEFTSIDRDQLNEKLHLAASRLFDKPKLAISALVEIALSSSGVKFNHSRLLARMSKSELRLKTSRSKHNSIDIDELIENLESGKNSIKTHSSINKICTPLDSFRKNTFDADFQFNKKLDHLEDCFDSECKNSIGQLAQLAFFSEHSGWLANVLKQLGKSSKRPNGYLNTTVQLERFALLLAVSCIGSIFVLKENWEGLGNLLQCKVQPNSEDRHEEDEPYYGTIASVTYLEQVIRYERRGERESNSYWRQDWISNFIWPCIEELNLFSDREEFDVSLDKLHYIQGFISKFRNSSFTTWSRWTVEHTPRYNFPIKPLLEPFFKENNHLGFVDPDEDKLLKCWDCYYDGNVNIIKKNRWK